ncbi:MAG: hypothetical protein ACUVUC_01765 [Thermoguttaceae bacterium]
MAAASRLRLFYLFHFSRPAHERALYRAIYRRQVRDILELGIGTGQRARRMIAVAQSHFPPGELSYTGVDPFEARAPETQPGLSLKAAYQMLRATGARIRLLPGDPFAALSRAANSLGKVDLVVVSAAVEPANLSKAWFYVPRLLHAHSLVVWERLAADRRPGFRVGSLRHVEELARRAGPRRAA